MFLSGLIPRPMNADNDRELLGLGIGFTNIVERTTRFVFNYGIALLLIFMINKVRLEAIFSMVLEQ